MSLKTKRRRIAFEEYVVQDDSEDDSSTRLPVLHRHTNIEVLPDGQAKSEHVLYTMPSSPGAAGGHYEAKAFGGAEMPADVVNLDTEVGFSATEEGDNSHLSRITVRPLLQWIPEINLFLEELLRQEGRGPIHSCYSCSDPLASYRCLDCLGKELFCKKCLLVGHRSNPFHRFQEWTGHFFARVSSRSLGIRIQLNHLFGEHCANPIKSYNDEFCIVDLNGIHEVALDYCGCHLVQPRPIQLLRSGLYPATVVDPKTAATFQVLEFFHTITLVSKISAHDFYTSLSRRSDNTGTQKIPNRYPAFLLMTRQWRHLKLVKRMGRNQLLGGNEPEAGNYAVLCPACPQPGKNLPLNWKEAPANQRWLYTLFIGLDANFRLKRLNVSKHADDPDLNKGQAYFVEEESFHNYLQNFESKIPNDTSTCSNYDAIKLASMRGGKGTAASGVGTVECIRHDMKRPASVGDLQKGERYINMDYIFLSSIQRNSPSRLLISYDIACQWSKNLQKRVNLYGPSFGSDIFNCRSATFAVPKAHLPVHQDTCKWQYSFNILPRVGRTDGEAPERGWAAINAIASSTKEMGPGSRRDTLDDHFGDYNWRKVTNLASALSNKFKEALAAQAEHVTAFEEFSSALHGEDVQEWTITIRKWEVDPLQPNPYEVKEKRISETQVRHQLAQQDLEGEGSESHLELSPSTLISQGLELEELQRRLRHDTKNLGLHATELQRARIAERSARLRRRIEAWQVYQNMYMPAVAMLRARVDQEDAALAVATDIDMMLPSQVLDRVTCNTKLIEFEWELRYAQASDTLHELQRLLLVRRQLYKSKEQYGIGQRHHTRSVALIKTVQAKVDRAVDRYRMTRVWLMNLAKVLMKVGWENTMRPLLDEDIRALEEDSVSEGRRTFTWIWRTGSVGDSEGAAQEILRIEWCKARARAHRWQEECLLLKEEMCRVLKFFEWEVLRWNQIAAPDLDANIPTELQEGRQAYAHRQAAIRIAMRERCEKTWHDIPEKVELAGNFKDKESGLVEIKCYQ